MNGINVKLIAWSTKLARFHLPRWEELPDIDLYMDQVVTLIEKYLGPLADHGGNKVITPAMVNNYVKLGMIPGPIKKRYNRTHLAYLIAISILKQVLTIQEVKDGVVYQAGLVGARKAFNLFCEEQEYAVHVIAAQVRGEEYEKPVQRTGGEDNLALRMATMALASKVLAEKVILEQASILKEKQEANKDTQTSKAAGK